MTTAVDIAPIFSEKDSILLFLAPPGWGKTTLILDFYEKFDGSVVFISPLRALAEEFYKRAISLKNVYSASDSEGISKFKKKKKSMLILTAEKLSDEIINESLKKKVLFIFDEFHLFYYWGDTFRPLLLEKLMAVANIEARVLALSATMSDYLLSRWKEDFSVAMSNCFLLNLGNQYLLNRPEKIYRMSMFSDGFFNRRLIRCIDDDSTRGTILVFCRYRKDVELWTEFCQRRKINALGCVGGQVDTFLEKLAKNPRPRVIVTTSALSHGVNLPIVSRVFITYPVNNEDFWVQMVGRGGRDGSSYELYDMERIKIKDLNKMLFRNFLKMMVISIRDIIYTCLIGRV
ncbi:DEAD/DEAH box helicase [Halobacteriovorax sp. HLS]|uniref:DEAD/DEAH box helicase n=1 Tax=Halobacteriovorax sp. HLS TaxID=2234000 RepID=UPI000FD88E94|nr:DEAD/DEAH box helicase [Halobacteriovorax sp. HLS]